MTRNFYFWQSVLGTKRGRILRPGWAILSQKCPVFLFFVPVLSQDARRWLRMAMMTRDGTFFCPRIVPSYFNLSQDEFYTTKRQRGFLCNLTTPAFILPVPVSRDASQNCPSKKSCQDGWKMASQDSPGMIQHSACTQPYSSLNKNNCRTHPRIVPSRPRMAIFSKKNCSRASFFADRFGHAAAVIRT